MNDDEINGTGTAREEGLARQGRFQRREQAILDALRGFIRDYAFQHYGARAASGRKGEIELRVTVEPEKGWQVAFEPELGMQVQTHIEDLLASYGIYQRGHVYCFRCGSASCHHSRPESPLHVFRGYSATGIPEWQELVQTFVDARDERIDTLFAEPPAVVAAVQLGRQLRQNQLTAFGRSSKTYAILGQVVAGYWHLPRKWTDSVQADRLAITFQAVEIRPAPGVIGLRINPVVGGLAFAQWDELLVSVLAECVGHPLKVATEHLEIIEREILVARQGGRTVELRRGLRRVPHVLGELARALEGGQRRQLRRTRHAQARSRPERPIHKALEDARAASDTDLFYDEKRGTWIACGKNGRTHVFSQEGKHVTSFFLPPGRAEFRVRTNRWRPLQKEEITRFRTLIAASPSRSAPMAEN
ncbi:MAG: hypothetical protein ACUVWX_02205 [Kiritimatiellia bacterium]